MAQISPTSMNATVLGSRKRSRHEAFHMDHDPHRAESRTSLGLHAAVPDTLDDDKDDNRVGVKRACNECRQQKLRCDVQQDPFRTCSRCRRCHLECRIDNNFKRVGKRKRNAEMEREIAQLRNQLAGQKSSPSSPQATQNTNSTATSTTNGQGQQPQVDSPLDQYMGSHDAVTSLLDLKSGDGYLKTASPPSSRRIEHIVLEHKQISELFRIFFTWYYPFVPSLDPSMTPDAYYDASPLLFWTIIAVASRNNAPQPNFLRSLSGSLQRLLWTTVADMPHGYWVVKALGLICVWPLPVSSTSADPTFMIAGLMMQIAMQMGLHRPSHAQDFSKYRVELMEDELRDRIRTWAACNVIAQRVNTGYGQPASLTHYDWTLAPSNIQGSGFKMLDGMNARLRIEMLSNRITQALYNNDADPVGLADSSSKAVLIKLFSREIENLEQGLLSEQEQARDVAPFATPPEINILYLSAVTLHLRLYVFFDSPSSPTYQEDLLALWSAITIFLQKAFDFSTPGGSNITYATNYLVQLITACGFALLKLLNSFFAQYIDVEQGKALFVKTVRMMRTISVVSNDLPSRMAEVLSQLWRASGVASRSSTTWTAASDDSLQLKVRCRMSMSLVYDSVWRWREEFRDKWGANLDVAVKDPTNPEVTSTSVSAAADPRSTSTIAHEGTNLASNTSVNGISGDEGSKTMDATLMPPATGLARTATPTGADLGSWNNEVFDPLNWMLDGLVDFPNFDLNGDLLGGSLS